MADNSQILCLSQPDTDIIIYILKTVVHISKVLIDCNAGHEICSADRTRWQHLVKGYVGVGDKSRVKLKLTCS